MDYQKNKDNSIKRLTPQEGFVIVYKEKHLHQSEINLIGVSVCVTTFIFVFE